MTRSKQKTYNEEFTRFLSILGENLPELESDVMQGWIQNPKAFQKFLAGLDQPIIKGEKSLIQTWRTITIGGVSAGELFALLEKRGHLTLSFEDAGKNVRAMMFGENFVTLPTPHIARLALVTPRELGFTKDPMLFPILDRARELGLSWHISLAPHLRLEWFDEPEFVSHYVPTEPILSENGELEIFGLDVHEYEHTLLIWNSSDTDWGGEETVMTHRFWVDQPMVFIVGETAPISISS